MDKLIMKQVAEILRKVQYTPTIPVKIYGKVYQLREVEVRALQIIARNKFLSDKNAFKEFNENVALPVLYISDKHPTTLQMTNNQFASDGHIVGILQTGFYDATGNLFLALHKSNITNNTVYWAELENEGK